MHSSRAREVTRIDEAARARATPGRMSLKGGLAGISPAPPRPMFLVCYRSAMRDRPPINPFVPGRGVLPPFLAGRDSEQHELMRLLAYVQAGRGAPREAVLSGPRGNGKTVLLRWLEREIEAAGKVDVVWRTPSDLPSLDALATALVPPARFRSLLPDTLSVSIGIGRLGWELGGDPGTLAELLDRALRPSTAGHPPG